MIRILIFTFSLLLSPVTMAFSYTLEIPEAELQKKVQKMMPLEKKVLFFKVILSEPEIELIEEDNKVGIFSHIQVVGPGSLQGKGRAKINGSLIYKAKKSGIYFIDPVIERLEIDEVDDKHIPQIKAIVQMAAKKMLKKLPVYKLKDDTLKEKLAKATLESIEIKEKKVLVNFNAF